MRKIYLITAILIFGSTLVMSQNQGNVLTISDLKATIKSDKIELSFTAMVNPQAAKSNQAITMTPVLIEADQKIALESIVVYGKRAKISQERKSMSGRSFQFDPNKTSKFVTKNGAVVQYRTTIPYQQWIDGAQMRLEGVSEGCCNFEPINNYMYAERIAVYDPMKNRQPIVEEKPVAQIKPVTKVEAEPTRFNYSFVAPISDYNKAKDKTSSGELFDYNMPLNMGGGLDNVKQKDLDRFIDDNREGSLVVYFKQGGSRIERGFGSNNRSLVELVTALREIEKSDDYQVVRVVVAGFASPEGSLQLNDRLAWDRAIAVKEFVLNNSNIPTRMVNLYNGSVDWRGLRNMVQESDMYAKHRIIDIIDYAPVWDSHRKVGRLGELMRLDGGDPYRYMFKYYFPLLRNAAYIKVYYDKKTTRQPYE